MKLPFLKLNIVLIIFSLLLISVPTFAQDSSKTEKKFSDTLDHSFDFSEFILSQTGFLPLVSIITEPAVGFGGGGGCLFFNPFSKKRKQELRSTLGTGNPPDMAIIFGMGTSNKTWGGGLLYKGFWFKDRIRYTGMIGKMSINMDYYGNDNIQLPTPITFNYNGIPFVQGIDVRFFDRFFLGAKYVYFGTKISITNGNLPESISNLELETISSLIAPSLYYDSRDNLMTPKQGLYIKATDRINRKDFGATFDYDNVQTFAIAYLPVSPKYVIGIRGDYQFTTDNAPFYAQPFVDLRGIPLMRYQGAKTLVLETEQTWYFHPRWAVNGFIGAGSAFSEFNEFSNNPIVVSGGAGFRYLGARLLGMYMGIDIAVGPEQAAVYLVFGNSWGKY